MRSRSKSVFTQREVDFAGKRKSQAYSDNEDPDDDHDDESASAANAHNWTIEEKMALLRQVEERLPKSDIIYYTTLSKIDWSQFEIGTHSAEDIKAQVNCLIKPVRKTRSLREIIGDCDIRTVKKSCEDKPKRPKSAYNLFFQDKFQKVKAKMEGEKSAVVMKKLSEMYKELPPKKKLKYKERAENCREEFEKAMEKFNQDHPEFRTLKREPQRKLKPMDLYIQELKDKKQYSSYAHARQQWSLLPMPSKVVYIKELLLSNNETPRTDVLNKKDMALLEEFHGRPAKPLSAYIVFGQDIRPELAGLPFNVCQKTIAERWAMLPPEAKLTYQTAAKKAKKEYKKKMQEYMSTLPQEERERLVTKMKRTVAKKEVVSTDDDGPKKKKKKPKVSNGSAGSEQEDGKGGNVKEVIEQPAPGRNIGVYTFTESDSDANRKKKKKPKKLEVEPPEEQPSSSSEGHKKKKKKKHDKEPELPAEPEPEPDTPTKKRKKDKHREEEFAVPELKSPKKRKEPDESSASSGSPQKKKKKKVKLYRPPKNSFTYFVLNYCDQDQSVAVNQWKTMSDAEKHTVNEEWDAAKTKFIRELQAHIVYQKSIGCEFKEEDILPCPVRHEAPDSD